MEGTSGPGYDTRLHRTPIRSTPTLPRRHADSPSRRRHPFFALVSLVVAVFAGSSRAAPVERPNLIFFLSDDQRADFLGCAGHEILKTPTMDRLAKNGTRFTNAFVTTAICAASRASLFTGLVETTHGFTFGTPPIARRFSDESYPALLRETGYHTGFIGKFGVQVEKGAVESMFDVFRALNRSPYHKKQKDGTTRHVSEIAGDRAVEFLGKAPADKPFCLSVSFNAPHAEDGDKKNHFPWPKAVDGLYDDVDIPPARFTDAELLERQPEFLKSSLNRVRWFWRWDTKEKYERNVRAYYRMITGVDGVMGRVLDALEKSGRSDNTVVVFCGDNGYYRGDRSFAGKWSHYDEARRIPLIVFDPRVRAENRGQVVDAMALNIDIPATLLDCAGVELPNRYQGKSLLPWVEGSVPVHWRSGHFCEHRMNHAKIPKWIGHHGERWLYARYYEQEPVVELLYDLEKDPHQLVDLAGDPGAKAALEAARERCLRAESAANWRK